MKFIKITKEIATPQMILFLNLIILGKQKAFNLPSIELINYEADDLIATYKVEAKKRKLKSQ